MTKKKNLQSLSMRIVILAIAKILIQAIGIITAPIFTRILSVSDYGTFSIYVSSCDMMAIILGLQTYSTLNNALHDYEAEEYKKYCANILLLSIISFIIGFIVFIVGAQFFPWSDTKLQVLLPVMIINAFGVYTINYATRYMNAQKDAVKNLIISVLIVLSTSILSIVLIMATDLSGIEGRVMGYSIPYIISAVLVMAVFIRRVDVRSLKQHWKYCLAISFPLIFHALSAIILGQGDRLVINHVLDETAAGIYSFCYMIAVPISIIWNASNTAWVPEYYDYMAAGEQEKLAAASKLYIRYFSILAGLLMLVSPEGVKILGTKEYYDGIPIVPVVIMGYYFNYLYSFPANYEFYHKKTKFIAGSTLATAILNIILNYILIPHYGILGAGIATMLSYIFLFMLHDVIARFVIKGFHYSYRFYMRGIVIVVPMLVTAYALLEHVIVRWSIAVLIAVICGGRELYKRKTIKH